MNIYFEDKYKENSGLTWVYPMFDMMQVCNLIQLWVLDSLGVLDQPDNNLDGANHNGKPTTH